MVSETGRRGRRPDLEQPGGAARTTAPGIEHRRDFRQSISGRSLIERAVILYGAAMAALLTFHNLGGSLKPLLDLVVGKL